MLFEFELLAPKGSLLGMIGSSLSQPPAFANGSEALAGADGFEAPPRSSWDPKAFENGSFYAGLGSGFAEELPPKMSVAVEEPPPKRSSCFVG
jgi:hypothetical protein